MATKILKLKKETERGDNSACFDAAVAFLASMNGTPFLPPSGNIMSPLKRVRIKLAPDAALEVGSERRIFAFWTIKDVKLTPRGAGVGLYTLQSELRTGNHSDCKFFMFDLIRKRQFDEQAIPNDAGRILNAELALLDSFFSE